MKLKTVVFVGNTSWSMYNFRKGVMEMLSQAGFRVVVLAPEDSYTKNIEDIPLEFYPLTHLESRGADPLKDFKLYLELKRYYRLLQPDIVFHYTIKPNIYGAFAAGSLGIKNISILTGLGYTFSAKDLVSFLARKLYSVSLKSASQVWFLQEEDRFEFLKMGWVTPSNTRVLNSEGVNTHYYKSPDNGQQPEIPAFLLFGRLIVDKGVEEYVEACALLKKRGYQFEGRLLGFIEEGRPHYIKNEQIREWEEAGIIRYLGSASDVIPFIAATTCIVAPSVLREGIPRSLLEAASLAKPIITTNITGCREVVDDGLTGYLCKVGDVSDLADKMELILRLTSRQRQEMGEAGRNKIVKEFDEANVIRHYSQVVSDLLK